MSSPAYEASIKFTEINQNALEILAVFNTQPRQELSVVDLINNLEITTRIGKSDHLCIEFGLDTSVEACYKGIHTKHIIEVTTYRQQKTLPKLTGT